MADSGHYYVYVNIDKQWYKFNDEFVEIATEDQAFEYNFGGADSVVELNTKELKVNSAISTNSSTAYMLVYVKQELKDVLLSGSHTFPEWILERNKTKIQEE